MKTIVALLMVAALMNAISIPAASLIAHRGASYDAPENSISSLKLGFVQGADAGECDIHLTADGKIVVMHDYDTARTTGVSNKISLAKFEDLAKLGVGKWGKWAGKPFEDTIPSLEQVLALIPEGKRLFIEIKCGPEVVPELERVLNLSGKAASQTPIIAFGYDTAKATKARMPRLEVSWLATSDRNTKQYPPIGELIAKAKAAQVDGLDLHYGFPIDADFVKQVHNAGLKLYVWTVDDPAIATRLAAAGVDGITTNRPEWLRQQLAQGKYP